MPAPSNQLSEVKEWLIHSMLNAGLSDAYVESEWMLERLGINRITQRTEPQTRLAESIMEKLNEFLARRLQREPLQYIMGHAPFRDWQFRVTPDVLIPRPETEELVDLVLNNHIEPARVAEMGTGSGAIIVSLALERPHWFCVSSDLSKEALNIARHNARILAVNEILFLEGYALEPLLPVGPFDIFVSNPPYISLTDLSLCEPEVKDYEPHTALTPGPNPLLFYEIFAKKLPKLLKPEGHLYLELDAAHAEQVKSLFFDAQVFHEIQLHKDLQGFNRFLSAQYRP